MTAIAVTMTAIENIFLPPILPLGAKLGLAGMAVMLTVIWLGWRYALPVVILKSVFVLATRGVTAFCMSLGGGVISFLVMLFVYKRFKPSTILLSVFGGISHNIGQLAVSALLLGSTAVFSYAPVLIIAGAAAGILTGAASKPIIDNLHIKPQIVSEREKL